MLTCLTHSSVTAPFLLARSLFHTQVLNEMEPVHLADLVGRDNIFVSVQDATVFCTARLAEQVGQLALQYKSGSRIGSEVRCLLLC
jgi:hypothetical protein